MARAIQSLVPLVLVRAFLALAAIAVLGPAHVHAAGREFLGERGHDPLGKGIALPFEVDGLVLDGDRAYVLHDWWYCPAWCIRGSRLSVYDLSTSGPGELLGSMGFLNQVRAFEIQGGFAYVASNYQFEVVDVSDPAAIRNVGTLVGWGVGPECVAAAGGRAYVGGNHGLHVVDVSNPASPSILGSLPLSARVVSLALDGPIAYVGTLDSSVVIVDVSNAAAPVVVTSIDMPGTPWDIDLRGSYAYVSNGASGLQILDVSDPALPRLAGGVDTPGDAHRTALSGARAYVVDRGPEPPYVIGELIAGTLQVIDVSNPAHPAIVNSIAGIDSVDGEKWWVHEEVRAIAADRGRVIEAGGLLQTWLGDCIDALRGPQCDQQVASLFSCDLVSGFLTVAPRVAYEALPPRARPHADPAAGAGTTVTTVPATFALRGNIPNPFGTSSSIRFETPKTSHVRIRILDVRGRLVKTLVDGAIAPGLHETTWRGRAESGEAAPSGIYFVTMEAESYRQTRKITRVK